MLFESDGKVYNPLGGGSYVYQDSLIQYLHSQLRKKKVRISIGAQPNSSPHFGTLEVFCLAFSLANMLKNYDSELEVSVFFEMVDTAPAIAKIIDNKKYQISLRESGEMDKYIDQYYEILEQLSTLSNVSYQVRGQKEFNKHASIPEIVKKVIDNREVLAPILEPKKHIIRIRAACPICGLTDKRGVENEFVGDKMICFCPEHGKFEVDINKESERLEYNTPLRNLIRGLVYSIDNQDEALDYEWLRITGSDYSGFYQEQLLYKTTDLLGYSVSKLPMILYAPLVTDWSGAKLSKSLYVKEGAYTYLPSYMINYDNLRKELGTMGLLKLYTEVHGWLEEPYKLFRNYSIYYFMEVLK